MAQFRATIHGQRGEASRLGSKKTGITAHVNGWDAGISVYAAHQNGRDAFEVRLTTGSNGYGSSRTLGTLVNTDKGNIWNPA
jgi:hypothetical protein